MSLIRENRRGNVRQERRREGEMLITKSYLVRGLMREDIEDALNGAPATAKEVAAIMDGDRWELWSGLPPLNFQEAVSRDGSLSLKAESNGLYIWVASDALKALKRDPAALLMANGRGPCSAMIFHAVVAPHISEAEPPNEPEREEKRADAAATLEREEGARWQLRRQLSARCRELNIKVIRNSPAARKYRDFWKNLNGRINRYGPR